MFTGLISKYGKLLVDILVIGIIILAIVWINPLGMFGGSTLKLNDTANNLSSIKKIGQLITAEYYGETIATYKQSKLNLIQEEDIEERADDLFRDMKDYLFEKHIEQISGKDTEGTSTEKSEKKKDSFVKRFFKSLFGKRKKEFKKSIDFPLPNTTSKDEANKEIPDFLIDDIELTKEVLAFYFKRSSVNGENEVKNLLWKLSKQIVKKKNKLNNEVTLGEYLDQPLPEINGTAFSQFHYKNKEKDADFSNRTRLSIIGRGSVKAGIDFGELNDDNFVFDEKHAVVHVYGVKPKILTKDINPWFIPEKKIPGFQILDSRKADFEKVKEVKEYCINKLEKMAIDAGILEQAERQSKEAIKNFIGLLTNSEIKEVYFHVDSLVRFTDKILSDQFISFNEAAQLDTLIPFQIKGIIKEEMAIKNWLSHQKKAEIKKVRLQNAVNKLQKTIFQRRENYYKRLSYLKEKIPLDNTISEDEIERLKKEKWKIEELFLSKDEEHIALKQQHRLWYGDSVFSFISEYNKLIDDLSVKVEKGETTIATNYGTQNIPVSDFYIKKENEEEYYFKKLKDFTTITLKRGLVYRKAPDTTFIEVENAFEFFKDKSNQKKEDYYLKLSPSQVSLEGKTDNYYIINEVEVNSEQERVLELLKYSVDLPINWKGELNEINKENPFFDKKILRKKSVEKLSANNNFLSVLQNYFGEVKNPLKTTKIEAVLVDENWEIKLTPEDISVEEKYIIEYVANYYLQKNKGYQWFSNASKNVKNNVEYKNLGRKMKDTKNWIEHILW